MKNVFGRVTMIRVSSISRYLKIVQRLSRHVVILSFLILVFPGELFAKQQQFADFDLQLSRNDDSLLLHGSFSFHFSEAALEALANGLLLVIDTEVVIEPAHGWYWQQSLASFNYKLEIQYHALSQQYLVKNIGDHHPRIFLTQASALSALGQVHQLALIDLSLLDLGEHYEVKIRSMLDSNSLPVPLRPLTYLSDEWRLRSGWKRLYWPVKN